VAGISRSEAESLLLEVLDEQRDEALQSLRAQRVDEHRAKIGASAKFSSKTVLSLAEQEFEAHWKDMDGRLGVVDPKMSIRFLNRRLQLRKKRTLNSHSLAKKLAPSEAPDELRSLIERLGRFISDS
jgi:hypothetical protein